MIVVNVVGFTVFLNGNQQTPPRNTTEVQNASNIEPQNNGSLVALADLGNHNSLSDCWVAYQGKVYDLTSWLPEHPGSAEAITPYCGKSQEFESAFDNQHGASQVAKLMQEGIYKGELL